MRLLTIVFIFALKLTCCYSIIISEVVFNFPYETERNQYIEILNTLPFTVDLRDYDIYLQGHKINLTNCTNDIESPVIGTNFNLEPGKFAIILPYEYINSSLPFYFSNVTVLFSTTKYLGKNGPIKKEDIDTIKIVSNNIVIDSLTPTSANSIGLERILVAGVTNLAPTDVISPGHMRNDSYLYFGNLLYDFPGTGEIFLHLQTNLSQINLEVLGRGEVTLTKISENLFRGIIVPVYNGEKIIVKFNDFYASSRFLNLFELRGLEENLIINEVCIHPSKSWFSYFSSGQFNDYISSSDKYIEIINLSKVPMTITNFYIHVLGLTNYYFRLIDNVYYSSKLGYTTELSQILPEDYVLAQIGDVKPETLIMLKDNHPYRGGKVLSFVEMKGINIFPFSHSNYYIYESNRTISLLPDGLPVKLGGKYRNYYETPAGYNGFSLPSILLDGEYKKVGDILKVWIVAKEKSSYSELSLKTKNGGMFRTFLITNQGFWYYRELKISEDSQGDIFVQQQDEIEIEFNYNGKKYSKKVFVIPNNSIPVSKSNNIVLGSSIVRRGEIVRVINVSMGDEIIILSDDYYPVMKFTSDKDGIFEFSTSSMLRGLYILVVKSKKGSFVSKFFVK